MVQQPKTRSLAAKRDPRTPRCGAQHAPVHTSVHSPELIVSANNESTKDSALCAWTRMTCLYTTSCLARSRSSAWRRPPSSPSLWTARRQENFQTTNHGTTLHGAGHSGGRNPDSSHTPLPTRHLRRSDDCGDLVVFTQTNQFLGQEVKGCTDNFALNSSHDTLLVRLGPALSLVAQGFGCPNVCRESASDTQRWPVTDGGGTQVGARRRNPVERGNRSAVGQPYTHTSCAGSHLLLHSQLFNEFLAALLGVVSAMGRGWGYGCTEYGCS
jgi:hypothetical protein